MIGALLAAAIVAAPLSQAAAPARSTAVAVRVEAAAAAPAEVKPAVDELRAAVEARKDDFRAPKAGEKPGLVVRVDAVKTADGTSSMNGALIKGEVVRPFALTYPGDMKALAAALARNLRGFADQMTPAAKPNSAS
jgi:hypothetical protein